MKPILLPVHCWILDAFFGDANPPYHVIEAFETAEEMGKPALRHRQRGAMVFGWDLMTEQKVEF